MVIKVIQNLFISNKFLFSNTMIIFVPQIKKSDHTIDRQNAQKHYTAYERHNTKMETRDTSGCITVLK